jgi:RHS repeat-associated protein
VKENGYETDFTYDASYERVKSEMKQNNGQLMNTRYYLDDYEKNVNASTGSVSFIHYVYGGDGLCTIVELNPNTQQASYHYVYKDHLGSILTVTDANGNIEAKQNFDAWGRFRDPSTWTYNYMPNNFSWLYRGFTGHEHMEEFGLINMNARLYDPVVGRMLSPDRYIQEPGFTQNYNRYSYCLNNPLKYVDPSGNFFFVLPMLSYDANSGWDVDVTVGVGAGPIGAYANVGYSSSNNNWRFSVGAYAAGFTASVGLGTQSGWSAYAGVGMFGFGGGLSSNVTSAGIGWGEQSGAFISALGLTYSSDGMSAGMSLSYGIGAGWRNLNEMEKIYGGGNDPEDAKRAVLIDGGILDEVVVKGEKLAHDMANSVILTITGVLSPIINQAHTIYKEGLHEGPAYYRENRNYAVPYELKNWKPVRTTDMMGETLSWDNGKKVINATVNTVSSVFPVKVVSPNYPILKYILPSVVKYPAKQGIKSTTHFQQ